MFDNEEADLNFQGRGQDALLTQQILARPWAMRRSAERTPEKLHNQLSTTSCR